jgi:hypothetical protein
MNTFTLKLTEQHLSVLSSALLKHPYGEAAPVVNEINKQIQEQLDSKNKDK